MCVSVCEREKEREIMETQRTMSITDMSVVASLIHLTLLVKDYLVDNLKPL